MRRYTISVKPAQRVSFLNSQVTLAEHFNGHVDVKVGDLSAAAQKGQLAFNRTCAACHGNNDEGSLKGPPLIHGIYNSWYL